jgi:hypothetical protein
MRDICARRAAELAWQAADGHTTGPASTTVTPLSGTGRPLLVPPLMPELPPLDPPEPPLLPPLPLPLPPPLLLLPPLPPPLPPPPASPNSTDNSKKRRRPPHRPIPPTGQRDGWPGLCVTPGETVTTGTGSPSVPLGPGEAPRLGATVGTTGLDGAR